MSGSNVVGLNEILELFESELSIADINASKYLGKISAAIVKKRIELKMTQKEFAKHMSVSQGMVSKWEGGDCNFTVKTLSEIAERLNLNLYISLKDNKENRNSNFVWSSQNIATYTVISEKKCNEEEIKPSKVVPMTRKNYINSSMPYIINFSSEKIRM